MTLFCHPQGKVSIRIRNVFCTFVIAVIPYTLGSILFHLVSTSGIYFFCYSSIWMNSSTRINVEYYVGSQLQWIVLGFLGHTFVLNNEFLANRSSHSSANLFFSSNETLVCVCVRVWKHFYFEMQILASLFFLLTFCFVCFPPRSFWFEPTRAWRSAFFHFFTVKHVE